METTSQVTDKNWKALIKPSKLDISSNEDSTNNLEKLISNNEGEVDNSVEQNKNFELTIINQIKKN